MSTELEDGLLEALRQIEARVDGAVGALTNSLPTTSTQSEVMKGEAGGVECV